MDVEPSGQHDLDDEMELGDAEPLSDEDEDLHYRRGHSDDEDEHDPYNEEGAAQDNPALPDDEVPAMEDDYMDAAGVDVEEPIGGTPVIVLKNINKHHDLDAPICHLYTLMTFGKAKGLSNATSNTFLEQMTVGLGLASGEAPADDKTGNIRTAMSRLGVLPDDYMRQCIVCPNLACWKLTPVRQLYLLDTPICGSPIPDTRQICQEPIYLVEGGRVQKPVKVMPFCNLSTWLAMFMQDDEVRTQLNSWRQTPDECPHDHQSAADSPPLSRNHPYYDEDTPLQGLSDGSAWRSGWANARRRVYQDNSVKDELDPGLFEPGETASRHSHLTFGLKIVINLDW